MRSEAPPEPVDEALNFRSEGLLLEGLLSYPAAASEAAGAVLLCPPHPFLGGDMNGNVLRALRSALVSRGCMVFSFNYRGIGKSETDRDLEVFQKEFWEHSTCPDYEAKIFVDCAAAFRTLTAAAEEAPPVWIAGYSFGCLPALDLASRNPRVQKAVLVSPPLAKWPLKEEYLKIRQGKAICFSPGDFACPEDRLEAAYAAFSEPKKLFRFESCGHFYVGSEEKLADTAAAFFFED